MAHAENEIVINRPIAEVFGFLADGLNNPLWRSGVVSIGLKSGKSGQLNAEYSQVLKGPGGRNIDGDYRITTLEPGVELGFSVIAGPARPTGRYLFTPEDEATRVRFILDYKLEGFTRLLGPMIQKTMDREVAYVYRLKQVLES